MTAPTAKHTPGPWDQARMSGPGVHEYRLGDSRNVCLGIIGGVDALTRDEDEANARLIAAAPTLLEALRALADDYDARFHQRRTPGQPFQTQRHLGHQRLETARAAIRLAEGET